jgi:hypothetical protein
MHAPRRQSEPFNEFTPDLLRRGDFPRAEGAREVREDGAFPARGAVARGRALHSHEAAAHSSQTRRHTDPGVIAERVAQHGLNPVPAKAGAQTANEINPARRVIRAMHEPLCGGLKFRAPLG